MTMDGEVRGMSWELGHFYGTNCKLNDSKLEEWTKLTKLCAYKEESFIYASMKNNFLWILSI